MNKVDISIIVPVYNVKLYLERCMKSLINQTYNNYEIILVDDGSSDGSGELCDGYTNYSKVKVIHQPNKGLSGARNTGIKNALGEYIMFVDSDDYIDVKSCEQFMNILKNGTFDIVCADAYRVTEKGITEKNKDRTNINIPCTGMDFLVESVSLKSMCMCAPFAVYRKKLIVENECWFKEGVLHEDELWTPQIFLLSQNVSYIPFRFYYHCERGGSINLSAWNEKRGKDIEYISFTLKEVYERKIADTKKRKVLLDHLCMLYLNSLNMTKNKRGSKSFLRETAYTKNNRIKALIYMVSPSIYFMVNPHKGLKIKR